MNELHIPDDGPALWYVHSDGRTISRADEPGTGIHGTGDVREKVLCRALLNLSEQMLETP